MTSQNISYIDMSTIAVPKLRDAKCVLILFPKTRFERDLNVIHECVYIYI